MHHVGEMVGKKLQQIKRNTFVRYWHHTALELFNYAAFKRL